MEDLASCPRDTVRRILSSVGGRDSSPEDQVDLSFVKPSVSRWNEYASDNWFCAIEEHCDAVVEEFLQGPANL